MRPLLCRESKASRTADEKSSNMERSMRYTHRNLFQILLNQTEIRLYLPCIYLEHQTDSFRLLFQINRCMVNRIWFQFDLIRFGKDFCVRQTGKTRTPRPKDSRHNEGPIEGGLLNSSNYCAGIIIANFGCYDVRRTGGLQLGPHDA